MGTIFNLRFVSEGQAARAFQAAPETTQGGYRTFDHAGLRIYRRPQGGPFFLDLPGFYLSALPSSLVSAMEAYPGDITLGDVVYHKDDGVIDELAAYLGSYADDPNYVDCAGVVDNTVTRHGPVQRIQASGPFEQAGQYFLAIRRREVLPKVWYQPLPPNLVTPTA